MVSSPVIGIEASLRNAGASGRRRLSGGPSPLEQGRAVSRRPEPLKLECEQLWRRSPVAYQTYGTLNADKSNAILAVPRADRRPARRQCASGDRKARLVVDPRRPRAPGRHEPLLRHLRQYPRRLHGLDGPRLHQSAKRAGPTGSSFRSSPSATWSTRRCASSIISAIQKLFSVIGGSMGGMQVLEWAARQPDACADGRADRRGAVALGRRTSPSTRSDGRPVMADPDWRGGDYYSHGVVPKNGLAVARMAAHITYLSEKALQGKFGRNLQDRSSRSFSFDADFKIESYLRHQGSTFVDRFDANSYLYITRAMDYFDLENEYGGKLANAFLGTKTPLLRRVVHERLALSDARAARPSCRRSTPWPPTYRSSRSTATKATTRSCSRSRSFMPPYAASSRRRARRSRRNRSSAAGGVR